VAVGRRADEHLAEAAGPVREHGNPRAEHVLLALPELAAGTGQLRDRLHRTPSSSPERPLWALTHRRQQGMPLSGTVTDRSRANSFRLSWIGTGSAGLKPARRDWNRLGGTGAGSAGRDLCAPRRRRSRSAGCPDCADIPLINV